MHTLYFAPGACSLGIHILLEELGQPYGLEKINLMEGDQHKPTYQAVNPKSKVPTLRLVDGSILTEFPAIAFYLTASAPAKGLWPTDLMAQTRAIETLDYVCGTLHMQGFARIFRPGNFTFDEAGLDQVRARGREMVDKGFGLLNAKLEGQDWICGRFSAADTAIFFVCFWYVTRLKAALPNNLKTHFDRMLARPSVQACLQQEGLTV